MNQDKTPATDGTAQGQETQIDPANTLTDKDGLLQVEQQDGDADDDLRCPTCGDWCQRLPEGQLQPTPEQLLQSCWVLPDGTQRKGNTFGWDNFCTTPLRITANLIDSVMNVGRGGGATPRDVIKTDLVRQVLKLAHRHPLVSDQLTLLLVDRLADIEVVIHRSKGPTSQEERVGLVLHLQGPAGVVHALKVRYHAEMLALLEALAPSHGEERDRVLVDLSWFPAAKSEKFGGKWWLGSFYEFHSFEVRELGSGDTWVITTTLQGGDRE